MDSPPPQASLAEASLSEEEQRLTGLGGWLILVGISLIVKPLYILFTMASIHLPLVVSGDLSKLTTEGLDTFIPHMEVLFWGEVLINSLMVCAWVLVAILFFMRKKAFKKWFIGLALINPFVLFFDVTTVIYVIPGNTFDPEDWAEIIKVLVYAGIWVPYMFLSKRVRLTFV